MTDLRRSVERVANCNVNLLRAGRGEPLLYLHGARGAGPWLPFMESLSRDFELFIPDHPGFSKSDTPLWLDNVGDLAYFYLDFIEKIGLTKVHLMGISLGGWIAAELAVRNQAALSTLTLVAAAGLYVQGAQNGDIFMWSAPELARNLFYDQSYSEAMLQTQPSEEEQDIQRKNRLATAKLAWQPRLHNPNLPKWLHRITVPTLIVWGNDDKIIPVQHGPVFRDLIPGSTLRIIANCGHLANIEKHDEFVAAVVPFLRGVRA